MKPRLTPEEARKDHHHMLMFMAKSCGLGMLVGLIASAGIFYFDIGGLWSLTSRASNMFLPVFLLTLPMCILLGGTFLGGALMTMPYETKYQDGSRRH